MIALERILLPTDFSDYSRQAIQYACELARQFAATIHVLHIVEPITLAMPSPGSALPQELLADAEQLGDAAKAVGETHRRAERLPGFGHKVYTTEDPRYPALMAKVSEAWQDDPRLAVVYSVRDVIGHRTDALPNVDLALGALSFMAEMQHEAGEAIFAIARTAGWVAHGIEEFSETPLRFRPRARYTGSRHQPD